MGHYIHYNIDTRLREAPTTLNKRKEESTMTKNSRYEIDHINAKVILTKQFAKAASILNTPEYLTLLELRRNHPDYTFELREIRKKEGKKSYRNLTYERMEDYIITREGKGSDAHKEFEQVKKLSQIQAGSYGYVKKWFLNKYEDEFKKKEEDKKDSSKKPELKLISNE